MWQSKQIMMNGELMPLEEARLHPLSLAVTYAATVFDGVRAYRLPETGQFALCRFQLVFEFDDDFFGRALADAGHTGDDGGLLIGDSEAQGIGRQGAQGGEGDLWADTADAEKQFKDGKFVGFFEAIQAQFVFPHL